VKLQPSTDVDVVMLCFVLMLHPPPSSTLVPQLQIQTCGIKKVGSFSLFGNLESGGGGEDTPLYSNFKVIAVPVLATVLHTAPLNYKKQTNKQTNKRAERSGKSHRIVCAESDLRVLLS